MAMSNYGRVIHQAQVEQMATAISGIVNNIGGDMSDWCAPITHFGQVLEMIKAGKSDEEITAAHPGWEGDALMVCHKKVDGTLTEPGELMPTEPYRKTAMQKAREQKTAIAERRRRKHGKG